MSALSVKEHLEKYHLADKIITMPSLTATVKEAANSLGCTEKEIAKTLSLKVNDNPIVIVMAGDVKIDNAKYRHHFHEKAKMLSPNEVEILTSHPIGGVCPFGLKENVTVYLDESLKRFTYVYPACGSIHNAIKITIPLLEEVTSHPEWIDVTKLPEE